jgi:hypothetical protein
MPTINCSLNIIGYCATPIEKMIARIGLEAELGKIGFGLGMVVIVSNLRSWAARLESQSDFKKRASVPAGLDSEFDYELTTT